jgi:hypothetical protein
MINRNNYEEYFLLYIDRELGPEEQSQVKEFLDRNPDLQKEFSLLEQTVSVPSATTYPDKAALFRQEKERRIYPAWWLRIAAALLVLLAGSWLLLMLKRSPALGLSSGSLTQTKAGPHKQPVVPAARQEGENSKEAGTAMTGKTIKPGSAGSARQAVNRTSAEPPAGKNHTASGKGENRQEAEGPGKTEAAGQMPYALEEHENSNRAPVTSALPALAENRSSPEPGSSLPLPATRPAAGTGPIAASTSSPATVKPEEAGGSSVLVFGDDNKTVSGLLRKLGGRQAGLYAGTDHRRRQVSVSIFRFSVKKE